MTFGVVPTGFQIKTQEEIYNSIFDGWTAIYGPGFSILEGSKEDQFLNLITDAISEVWEMGHDNYLSMDASQAEGVRLDQIGQWNGAGTRDPGDDDDDYRPVVLAPNDKASNLTEDILGKVINLPGTDIVYLLENRTDVIDANGLPPHSYSVVVEGGVTQDIIDTIWKSGPTAIAPFGNTGASVLDAYGFCRSIGFTRPTFVDILVEVDVTLFSLSATCTSQSEDDIARAMQDYLVENKVGRGTTIFLSQVSAAAASAQGVAVQAVRMAISPGSPIASDIPLTYDQIANWVIGNMTVNIL